MAMSWCSYPTKQLKELINLILIILGIALLGFEMRPLWAHLVAQLWISPLGFIQEAGGFFLSGMPYVALAEILCIIILLVLMFVFV